MSEACAGDIETPWGTLRPFIRDGQQMYRLSCPQCGHWGEIDDDQLHGRISLDHTNCGITYESSECNCTWHETHDYQPFVAEHAAFRARLAQRITEDRPLLDAIERGPGPGAAGGEEKP